MDRIKKIKIKKQDGTFSDYIPIGADAENIDTTDGESVQLKLDKKPYYYNNVADMKADNKLKAGDMAITLGYYEADDGGAGKYYIVNETNNYYEILKNNLKAELITENSSINVKQLGAKGDNKKDDTDSIQNAINKFNSIYIPNGTYLISQIILKKQTNILGESIENTILSTINNNINDSLIKNLDSTSIRINLKNFTILGWKERNNIINGIDFKNIYDNGDAYIIIDNVKTIYLTGNGIHIGRGVEYHIKNCQSLNNGGCGIFLDWGATDSTIVNTNCAFNKLEGLKVISGSNRFENIKCYVNGIGDGINSGTSYYDRLPGIYNKGDKNVFINCGCQENSGDGFLNENSLDTQIIGYQGDNNGLYKNEDGKPIALPTDITPTYNGLTLKNVQRCNVIADFNNFRDIARSQNYGLKIINSTQINGHINAFRQISSRINYDNQSNLIDLIVDGARVYINNTITTPTLNDDIINNNNYPLTLEKQDNLVIMSGVIRLPNALTSTELTIGNVPTDYKPTRNTRLTVTLMYTNSNGNTTKYLASGFIDTNGAIKIRFAGSENDGTYAQIVGIWFATNKW